MRSTFALRLPGSGLAALLTAFMLFVIAGSAGAMVTSLRMESDPGDPIGLGQSYMMSPADGSFSLSGDGGHVLVTFTPSGPGDSWTLSFNVPGGDLVGSGASFSASALPPDGSGLPEMDVSGGGRTADWVSGSFDVRQLTLDANGQPTALWAVFEQHCDGDVPALRGDLRVNADVIVDVQAPFAEIVTPGQSIVFFALATDEMGGWVAFDADGVPPGAFFMDFFDNSAVFVWTPSPSDQGVHRVTFRGDNGQGMVGETETFIRVGAPSAPPVASAGGPYEGLAGMPVQFDGSASFDSDSPSLGFWWDFGDGATSQAMSPVHAFAAGGSYTARLVVCDGDRCVMDEAQVNVTESMAGARAFTTPDDKAIRLGTGRPYFTVRLEPDAGSFELESVMLPSLALRSEGTGSVASVACVPGRTAMSKDSDHNKVAEIAVVFAIPDLRDLFSDLDGEQAVPVTVEGTLDDGRPFRAELTVTVIAGPGNSLGAKLNQKSDGGVSLALSEASPVTLKLFDVSGRLVSEVLSNREFQAGEHPLALSGVGGISPGIYFYQLRTNTDVTTGRLYLSR